MYVRESTGKKTSENLWQTFLGYRGVNLHTAYSPCNKFLLEGVKVFRRNSITVPSSQLTIVTLVFTLTELVVE